MGCVPTILRRVIQGWLIAKALAWFRRRRGGDVR